MSNRDIDNAIYRKHKENALREMSITPAQREAKKFRNDMLYSASQQAIRTGFDIAGSAAKSSINTKQDIRKILAASQIKKGRP